MPERKQNLAIGKFKIINYCIIIATNVDYCEDSFVFVGLHNV